MDTCKECRWWDTKPAFNDEEDAHECLNPELRITPCCEPRDIFGSQSGVATYPDFGCIQFARSML